MNRWPIDVGGYSQDEVKTYCVNDPEWQSYRETMKGETTEVKLDMLHWWYEKRINEFPRRTKVQCDNYINALKRGGQLTIMMEVHS